MSQSKLSWSSGTGSTWNANWDQLCGQQRKSRFKCIDLKMQQWKVLIGEPGHLHSYPNSSTSELYDPGAGIHHGRSHPWQKSCGRELLSKASELNGLPRLSQASTPKPESVCFTISWLSPTPLTLTGVYSWPPFSGENQLRAIANKSSGHEKNISNQNPSVSIIACLAGIFRPLQLRIWLFASSQLWEAWKA